MNNLKADGIFTECMFTRVGNTVHFWTGLKRNPDGTLANNQLTVH